MMELVAGVSKLEAGAVVFAIAYLVLAIRQSVLCWPAALISVALFLVLFYDARLYMEAALQVFEVFASGTLADEVYVLDDVAGKRIAIAPQALKAKYRKE